MNPLHIAFVAVVFAALILGGIWQEQRRFARNRWLP